MRLVRNELPKLLMICKEFNLKIYNARDMRKALGIHKQMENVNLN